jgi:hypothetical protein
LWERLVGYSDRASQDGAVFVFVGQHSERVEVMELWAVRSVVRLCPLDECERGAGRGQTGQRPMPVSFSLARGLRK